MFKIDLKERGDDLRDLLGVFDAEAERKAVASALNRAAQGVITDASKAIRLRYKQLKKRDVDEAFSVKRATAGDLAAVVTVRGRPLSLARFLAGQITARGRGGVWVNVKGQRKFIPHVWAQTLKNKAGDDYIVLMARVGKERYPVEVLKTIDIPSTFTVREVFDYVTEQVDIRFDAALKRGLAFFQRD